MPSAIGTGCLNSRGGGFTSPLQVVSMLPTNNAPTNVIEKLAIATLVCESVVLKSHTTRSLRANNLGTERAVAAVPATLNLHALEKDAILKAIDQHQGNLSKAAQALGLGRTTLYRKMLRHGIQ